MPQDPLLQALLHRAQQRVERKILPQPAGEALPSAMQAADIVRKVFPADMVGVKVKDMPWKAPEAFSNDIAETPVYGWSTDDPYTISVNPAYGIMNGSSELAPVIAHELQHIRQNRRSEDDPAYRASRIQEFRLPYAKRPDEIAARSAEENFPEQPPQYLRANDANMVIDQLRRMFVPSSK